MFAARRGRKKTPSLSLPPSSVHGGRLFIRAASPSVIHAIHNEPSLIWLGRGKRKENFEEEEKQVVPSATPAVPAGLPGRPSLSWGGTIVTSPILSYFVFSFFFLRCVAVHVVLIDDALRLEAAPAVSSTAGLLKLSRDWLRNPFGRSSKEHPRSGRRSRLAHFLYGGGMRGRRFIRFGARRSREQ